MAGIYIHIPFCKQACHYCNFHFSTNLSYRSQMVEAILKETQLTQNYLKQKNLKSIYFGGGTPSILSASEISRILERIGKYYSIDDKAEITLEANPDDLNRSKIKDLKKAGINRLSIGIQSFFDEELRYFNRAHSAKEAHACILDSQDIGFNNFSIDLIYGSPISNQERWNANLEKFIDYKINHLSAYALTVEENTALHSFIKKGKSEPLSDNQMENNFLYMLEFLDRHGYIQYEISNFGKPDHLAVHNTNYWKGVEYLGLGPSAHSFNGHSRQWNVAHNHQYLKAISEEKLPFTKEELSISERFNEYIMTSFRTMWGCSLEEISKFGESYVNHFNKTLKSSDPAYFIQSSDKTILSKQGKLFADRLASDFFL